MKKKPTRAHYVLFCHNTPFKPKKVENKMAYKRQPKHKSEFKLIEEKRIT